MAIQSINPTTGEVLETFDPLTDGELEGKLVLAEGAFQSWRRVGLPERSALMHRLATALEDQKLACSEVMTIEMGKPIASAVAEVEKCAWVCRHYADNAQDYIADEPAETDAKKSYVRYQPLGPILAIMPWNFPFWQVIRFAAPSVMAGNVGLLKHASNVPQCALMIERLFEEAGFPNGIFQTLLVGAGRVEQVLGDRRIMAVTLTGSSAAGKSVARTAGSRLKKSVLELGGSDPFIVLPSADLRVAADVAVKARVQNNGQSCIAAKRFIVHEEIADEFEGEFTRRMASLIVGDPLDPKTDIGPMATREIREELDRQVQDTIAAGAVAALGGRPMDRPGYFYEPTVLKDIPAHTPAVEDELFGPVASLFRVRGLKEAIYMANDSPFGLGASAWTTDVDEQELLVNELEAGSVFVNGMVKSDPRLPFGGVKGSGYGRELGQHGIREFVNAKSVWIG